MAVLLVVLVLLVSIGEVGATAASPAPRASLTVTFWPDERQPGTLSRWTLRCDPLGGTLPGRRTACRRLARLTAASFAPVASSAVCTQIYGGPQKAVVKGTLNGTRIWASFRRRNGCEIERWQRFSPWLLPSGGAADR